MSNEILRSATPIAIVCVQDRQRSLPFYRDLLGLEFVRESEFAAVFKIGGIELLVTTVPNFKPHEHPVIDFRIADIETVVRGLNQKGVQCEIYPGFGQDASGIWTSPDKSTRLAWFKDPDGNVLGLSQK